MHPMITAAIAADRHDRLLRRAVDDRLARTMRAGTTTTRRAATAKLRRGRFAFLNG